MNEQSGQGNAWNCWPCWPRICRCGNPKTLGECRRESKE